MYSDVGECAVLLVMQLCVYSDVGECAVLLLMLWCVYSDVVVCVALLVNTYVDIVFTCYVYSALV